MHTNRLAREQSPYLLQHQHNPVDWFAWGEEAFSKARREGKPIFLSIGYSTCHWCHVMERESFEDERVAAFLNAHFVSIKVDREERPDVDKIYMTAVQTLSGQGGWPLNAFLTTDLKPFFGGTYFPPRSTKRQPGFLDLLEGLANLWREKRDEIAKSSNDFHKRLIEISERSNENEVALSHVILKKAAATFCREYDSMDGGFGRAPKFPRPSFPAFLLQYGMRNGKREMVEKVLHTCRRMALGGIYDQLGGGFARYSVDSKWLVPHFEKMLYDNAQLIILYIDAFLVSGESFFARIAKETIDYIARDMTHSAGGFFSAEDADSEGKEGKFYCWTKSELEEILEPDELALVLCHFGITASGNFLDHSDPKALVGQNVLSIANDILSSEKDLFEKAKAKMFSVRSKRVRPHRDDKILVSWNGLMIAALARAFGVLRRKKDLDAARRCCDFLWQNLWDEARGCLFHRWREGQHDAVQLFQAYAFFLFGLVELYQVTLMPIYLSRSILIADAMIARFYDAHSGGFWQSEKAADLILQLKEDYDGAEPSGNSVAMLTLQKLATICDRSDYDQVVKHCFKTFSERMDQLPQALPMMLMALDFSLEKPRRIVCQGDLQNPKLQSLLHASHSVYQPNKIVMGTEGKVASFFAGLQNQDNEIRAFCCSGNACQEPTKEPEQITAFLSKST